MADALDSKSGIRKGVWVRVPPSAPLGKRWEDQNQPLNRLQDMGLQGGGGTSQRDWK